VIGENCGIGLLEGAVLAALCMEFLEARRAALNKTIRFNATCAAA